MKKIDDFYLSLDYQILMRKIPEEDGGGWYAELPELPGCMSDGETVDEALTNLNDAKKKWISVALKRGQSIPMPKSDDEEFSGKFTLRVPKSLHKTLAVSAKADGISLNQYVISLLSYNFGMKCACSDNKSCKKENASINWVIIQNTPEHVKSSWDEYLNQGQLGSSENPFFRYTERALSKGRRLEEEFNG